MYINILKKVNVEVGSYGLILLRNQLYPYL